MQVMPVQLAADEVFPNNVVPALIYRRVITSVEDDPAAAFEELFESNGWTDAWRNGIYDYHHYHSTAHEVLGIARGNVKVHLGGPRGRVFELSAGDVVVIPAGVSHKNVGSSSDLLVVGAYPKGTSPDMCYGKEGERPRADANIAAVPLPASDPVVGKNGGLVQEWRTDSSSSESASDRMINEDLLGIYLNDHLSGSVLGVDTIRSCLETVDGPIRAELEELLLEIEQDQAVLKEVMAQFSFSQNALKKAAAWLTEKAARLKVGSGPSDPQHAAFRMMERLEMLSLGISGKRMLWKLLETVVADEPRLSGFDFHHLIKTATDQVSRVDAMRLDLAREALRTTDAN